ncbi:hypothetical protein B566_EDAN006039, partial [Ephemera danica]
MPRAAAAAAAVDCPAPASGTDSSPRLTTLIADYGLEMNLNLIEGCNALRDIRLPTALQSSGMEPSRAFAVCLVVVASATAQYHYGPAAYSADGLIFWVPMPLLRQPAVSSYHHYQHHHHQQQQQSPIINVAKAAAVPTHSSSDSVTINADAPAPNVITQGLHLGDNDDNNDQNASGFAEDAPASVITHGPQPGAYTAVSSDEQSESTQFHSQDGQGQFIFGHSSPEQVRLESRTADGTVRGSYSYINPEGRTIKVTYTAGENGFQPVEDPNSDVLPKPVTETPEVAAARALHARLYDQARWLAESSPDDSKDEQPVQVPAPVAPASEPVNGAAADPFYQPDSLYTNLGSVGVESSDEELSYYGAAKGKPLPYVNNVFTSNNAHHDYYGLPKGAGSPLAFSGAYFFPNQQQIPSTPVNKEQQNNEGGSRNESPIEVLQARTVPTAPQDLEYYGAAKLLAYAAVDNFFNNEPSRRGGKALFNSDTPSVPAAPANQETQSDDDKASDSVVVEAREPTSDDSPVASDTSDSVITEAQKDSPVVPETPAQDSPAAPETITPVKSTPVATESDKAREPPSEARFSTYQLAAPVFVAVGVVPQDDTKEIASVRTNLDSQLTNIPPPVSVSQKAAYFGAVPVAAVHDAQVAPGQVVKDHQRLP